MPFETIPAHQSGNVLSRYQEGDTILHRDGTTDLLPSPAIHAHYRRRGDYLDFLAVTLANGERVESR